MVVTTLGPGQVNKAGVVEFNGHKCNVTWQTSIPNDAAMKSCTEAVCAEAAKSREFTHCLIRSAPHRSSRVGGQNSNTYVKDALHVTASFTKVRWGNSTKPVTAHIYCGPDSNPQNYSQTSIYREGGKPALVWYDQQQPQQQQQSPQGQQGY